MSDADIYRSQGLGQSLSSGTRPALLVVDFSNGFLDPDVFGGGNIARAARNTVPVLKLARSTGMPVFHTRIVYAADGSDAGIWCEKVPGLRRLTEDAPESQIVPFLAPAPEETVIRKRQASAFFGTGLADQLRSAGIDSLLVAGCTTSGCIRATIIDAISHDFRPFLVPECVGDRASGPHEANLFDIEQKYADLVPFAGVADWLARFGTVPAPT